jgi:tetratricopeptide (TPR) repeat protein
VDIAGLELKAIEFARRGDFGVAAKQTNEELARAAPANQGAWTRLARCCIELGLLDDANAALETVLNLNPQNMIARSLLQESIRREVRAAPVDDAGPRPRGKTARGRRTAAGVGRTGFGRAQFAALGQLAPASALESLGPSMESLLMALNDRPFAPKVVEARNRAGQSGSKLFRRNSFYSGGAGHIYCFQHGGRWEPQINIAISASPQWDRDSVRAGIGFNLTQAGSDPNREAGLQRVLTYFENFQQLVSNAWKKLLADWMAANGGFIQLGDKPPAVDLMPADAVTSLINVRQPTDVGWVFCGRWLFLDRADDAAILADQGQLVKWTEQTFTDLLPLWMSVYRE